MTDEERELAALRMDRDAEPGIYDSDASWFVQSMSAALGARGTTSSVIGMCQAGGAANPQPSTDPFHAGAIAIVDSGSVDRARRCAAIFARLGRYAPNPKRFGLESKEEIAAARERAREDQRLLWLYYGADGSLRQQFKALGWLAGPSVYIETNRETMDRLVRACATLANSRPEPPAKQTRRELAAFRQRLNNWEAQQKAAGRFMRGARRRARARMKEVHRSWNACRRQIAREARAALEEDFREPLSDALEWWRRWEGRS